MKQQTNDTLAASLQDLALRGNLEDACALVVGALGAESGWVFARDRLIAGSRELWAQDGPHRHTHALSDTLRLVLQKDAPWTDAPDLDHAAPWLCAAAQIRLARTEACEANERYEALLHAGFEGICLHRDGVLLEVNQALADLYGYTRDEMIGMHVRELAAPHILDKIRKIVHRGHGEPYETAALCKDQSVIPLEARGKNAVFMGQAVRVAAFRDLRPWKAAEAALVEARQTAEQASASKTRFLGNMSHELRTPMQGILGLTDLLMETALTDPQRSHLASLKSSAESQLALLDDLIDVTRIEEGQLRLQQLPFSVSAVVRGAVDVVRVRAASKGLALEIAEGCPGGHYLGDGKRLRQVLVNLLGNAVKFTDSGSICLSARAADAGIQFALTDTGIGMTPEQLSRVFGRFTQAEEDTARRYGGSGLGLNISQGLISAMGGELRAESKPGQGSCFRFTLPLQPVRAPAAPAQADLPAVRPLQVLLAEDNAINQLIISRMLEKLGHTVHQVGDGQQCLAAVEELSPDVILMDIQMPVLDGLCATLALRERGVRTPVFALTANVMESDRLSCLQAGMDAFLTKPIRIERLRAALAEHFA